MITHSFFKRAKLKQALNTEIGVETHADKNEVEHETKYLGNLPETIIILDATWQEACQMLKQSSYLKAANKFALPERVQSQFTLRCNQVQESLFTLECIIEICQLSSMDREAAELDQVFTKFNQNN